MAFSGERPSVPNNPDRNDTQEPAIAGDEPEENENKKDLNDDIFPETQDSNHGDEAQEQPSSSAIVTKKFKVSRNLPYKIETDEDGIEWFCEAGRKQSKLGIFAENADSKMFLYLLFLNRNGIPFRHSI